MLDTLKITDDLVFVGYYLSRLSDPISGEPPVGLCASDWNDAYDTFAHALGNGQSQKQFRHTLETVRNAFDTFHDNPRQGLFIEPKNIHLLEGRADFVVAHFSWSDDRLDMRAFQIASGHNALSNKVAQPVLHPTT
jgi:hypothetical protein